MFLIVNGFILYFGNRIGEDGLVGTLDQLNWKEAKKVGDAQCFALIHVVFRCGLKQYVAGVVAGLKPRKQPAFRS